MIREALLVGAVLGLYYLSNEEKKAKEQWKQKREEVEKTIEEHQSYIDKNLKQAQNSYDFHYLTEVHYSSMMVGNNAYSLLKDARKTENGIGKLLRKSKKHKEELIKKIKIRGTPNKKHMKEELKTLNEMRKTLFDERDKIKKEKEVMLEKVQNLNKGTRSLKLHIKEYCGNRGLCWYNKIEENKARRALEKKN